MLLRPPARRTRLGLILQHRAALLNHLMRLALFQRQRPLLTVVATASALAQAAEGHLAVVVLLLASGNISLVAQLLHILLLLCVVAVLTAYSLPLSAIRRHSRN